MTSSIKDSGKKYVKKAKPLTAPKLLAEGSGQCSDLIYRSGFHPVDPVIFLDESSRRTLVVPLLEYGRARAETSQVHVVLPEELGVPKPELRSAANWALYLLRTRGIRRVLVSSTFPVGIARVLEKNGMRVDVEPRMLYPERAVKSAAEIKLITASQRAAVRAMRAAHQVLRGSEAGRNGVLRWRGRVLTSETLRMVIDRELLSCACAARDTIVAGAAQAADPHERGHGPLRAGTSIVVDIFPQHKQTAYWGDITRTFCVGKPPPVLAHMYRAVLKAQQRALAMIKPGVAGNEIHEMIATFFDREGFPMTVTDGVVRGFFHGTGHGVGLDIHESPSISRAEVKLQRGHVVTVEPGLYDPDIGGVRIEDTVVVEASGARLLAGYPKRLEV